MDHNTLRGELKRMDKRNLLKLAWQQRTRWCNIGASECVCFILYKGFSFCLTELLGKGCPAELESGREYRYNSAKDQPQISPPAFRSPIRILEESQFLS